MPPLPPEQQARWTGALPSIVNHAVQFFRRHRATLDGATRQEFVAAGLYAVDEVRKEMAPEALTIPHQWGWSYKRWQVVVRREFARALANDDATEGMRTLREGGEVRGIAPVAHVPALAPAPYHDTRTRPHPGFVVFEGVFNAAEVDELRDARRTARHWESLFNGVEWTPTKRTFERMTKKVKTGKEDFERIVSPPYKAATDWKYNITYSSFRKQATVDDATLEAKVISKLKDLLPAGAVFPPAGNILSMIINDESVPSDVSREPQPMHYDFPPGAATAGHLSVLIALTDHCHLHVADRWGEDRTKTWKVVHIPKGAVLVFASSLPHGGMGSVGIDGCERIHIYVAFNVRPEDVHPKDGEGHQETFFAALERKPRL